MRFIAVCEVLGALGLVLPGVFRIRTDLTPLAAAGLVVIMTLAAVVAYGRSRVAPLTDRHSSRAALHPAI